MDRERRSITWAALQISRGSTGPTDAEAAQILYDELHRLAKTAMVNEEPDSQLETTDIVHKAFERLFLRPRISGALQHWPNRFVFFCAAAKMIHDILVDEARKRLAVKRGGRVKIISLDSVGDPFSATPEMLLSLHDELQALQELNERAALVVELRFFCGFSFAEIAEMMEISPRTAQREWDLARLWLYRRLRAEHHPDAAEWSPAPHRNGDRRHPDDA